MKKILVLLLCFNIVLAPSYAFANSSLGGWTITNQIAQGASTIINATKSGIENGVNIVKTSTAKITPNATQVAKVLRGGAYGYAISVALEQLLGFVVDWTLEPENNRISYIPPGSTVYQSSYAGMDYSIKYYSLTTLCSAALQAAKTYYNGATSYSIVGSSCRINYGNTGAYDNVPYTSSQEQQQKRYVSLDTIAAQVISNAESSTDEQKKAGAQAATTAAAQDILANDSATQSDVETQLNANAKTQTNEEATGNTKPNESNPEVTDISLSFPAFCGWAPSVCQAANVVINFPTTLTNWWNTATQAISASWLSFKEWLDWTKNDSELPETETNHVTEIPIPELQENAISWSASCPPDVQVPINLYGQSSTLTFSWSPWCQLLNVIKPAIIASSYIGAAFIVLGLRT